LIGERDGSEVRKRIEGEEKRREGRTVTSMYPAVPSLVQSRFSLALREDLLWW